MLRSARPIEFCGSARTDLRNFPQDARREAGRQLFRVQLGEEPDDWKPMGSVAPGVREIRIREKSGAYRILYVASFRDAIYVLHCFQKKTQRTSPSDLVLAKQRYKELLRELDS